MPIIEGLARRPWTACSRHCGGTRTWPGGHSRVCVSLTERSVPPLDPATEVVVYRVALEALHNALRHPGRRCVTVSVSGASRRVVLEVTDDGSGFDPSSAQGRGLGLASMRQRAAAAGGTVRVVSAPGQGTRVRLEAPVRA
jgi:signal transduction histidine kinase